MPAKQATFYLSTCDGLHEVMWQTTSHMIDDIIQVSWKCLPFLLIIRLITDELKNRSNGVIDLRVHMKTIFEAAAIIFFLASYKWTLESFDKFISLLYIIKPHFKTTAADGYNAWYEAMSKIITILFDNFPRIIAMACHEGHKFAIDIMHYSKIFLLLLSSLLGPLAAIGTLLPSFMRSSFVTWARSYVNISCWGITLNILEAFAAAHNEASRLSDSFKDTSTYIIISIVLFVAIFLTPTITSKFIGNAILPNLGNTLSFASSMGGKALSFFSPSMGGVTKGASNLLGGLKRFAKK